MKNIKYIGQDKGNVLFKDETYKVKEMFDKGIRVYTSTGFAGIPNKDYIEI